MVCAQHQSYQSRASDRQPIQTVSALHVQAHMHVESPVLLLQPGVGQTHVTWCYQCLSYSDRDSVAARGCSSRILTSFSVVMHTLIATQYLRLITAAIGCCMSSQYQGLEVADIVMRACNMRYLRHQCQKQKAAGCAMGRHHLFWMTLASTPDVGLVLW